MKSKPLVLDDTDKAIISELEKNGRESYKNIAKRLGVSDGTVRLRTERMVKSGYLRISASVNPLYFGDSLLALVGINLANPANKEIMRRIGDLQGVQSVVNVSGRFDLMVEVFVASRDELRRFLIDDLSEVGGITSTESFVLLDGVGKWVEQKA